VPAEGPATVAARIARPCSRSSSWAALVVGTTTGKIRWSHHTGGFVYSSPAESRQRVYAGSYDKNLYCFDGYSKLYALVRK